MTFNCSEFGTAEKAKIPGSGKLEGILRMGNQEGRHPDTGSHFSARCHDSDDLLKESFA